MSRRLLELRLRAIQAADRLRLQQLRRTQPGLEVHPQASPCLALARYQIAPGARLRIAAGVVTERLRARLHFYLEPGAEIWIGEGAWLRTELGEVHLCAYAGARLHVGPESLLNACHLSAKRELTLGRRVFVGPGSRVFDADQHDLDDARSERVEPVSLGDHAWVASDCTVTRGVRIGAHSVVGARSLVTRDVPPHTLAFGQPAEPRGTVGDRSRAP
jgi:acetyltransferase-like isoleucine patch superfamily enzyme